MPCHLLPGGEILCTSRGRAKRTPCFVRDCKTRATNLCDWQLMEGRPLREGLVHPTCSRSGCTHHVRRASDGKDYCLEHYIAWRKAGGKA